MGKTTSTASWKMVAPMMTIRRVKPARRAALNCQKQLRGQPIDIPIRWFCDLNELSHDRVRLPDMVEPERVPKFVSEYRIDVDASAGSVENVLEVTLIPAGIVREV